LTGPSSVPTDQEWIDGLETNLENIYQYGLNYNINSEQVVISNSGCVEQFAGKTLSINIGINVSINCS
jgi:hypothetical protein